MKCEKCSWYVWREYTAEERDWLKHHPNCYIVAKFCTLGGCDGSRFISKERKEEYVTLHHEDIHFIDEDAERIFYESLTERKEE